MKHISFYGASALRDYGINYLTGESDAYGQRGLCDLSQKGVKLLCDFLGLPYNPEGNGAPFAPNWNSKVGEDDSVASVMLTRGTVKDLALFALFHVNGCHRVVTGHHEMWGLFGDKQSMDYLEFANKANASCPDTYRIYENLGRRKDGACENGRNVHAFTGRAA